MTSSAFPLLSQHSEHGLPDGLGLDTVDDGVEHRGHPQVHVGNKGVYYGGKVREGVQRPRCFCDATGGEAGARVWRGGGTRVLLIFQCVLFSFQTFGGSAQMLGENKEISAGG